MDDQIKLDEANKLTSLLHALMRQIYRLDDDLAVNLPLAQLRVCVILHDGQRTMSALSHELGVSLSAMTQIADRLERAKLVFRVTDNSDRRIRCLQLTPQGEKIMHRHEQSRIRNVLAVLNNLSPGARKEILAALETLLEASIAVKTETVSNEKCSKDLSYRREESFIPKVIS